MPRSLIVQILGDATQYGAELDKAAGKTRQIGKVAGVAGLAIAGGLAVGLEQSVKAAMSAQVETARLDTAFKTAGLGATDYQGAVLKAEDSSRKLGFSNEDVRNSLGSLVVATHNTRSAVSDLGVAEDLARFKHVDLATASKTLSMAMAGSQRAIKQLGLTMPPVTAAADKVSAAFKDHSTQAYKAAEATAKLQDKQTTIQRVIALVTEKMHGQAAAFAGTAAGGMAQFHAQTQALEENLGQALLPAVVAVTGELAKFAGFLAQHATVAKILVGVLGALAAVLLTVLVATKIAAAAEAIFDAVSAANPFVLLALALVALGVAIYELATHWKQVTEVLRQVWDKIKQVFDEGIQFVKDHWRLFVVALATIIAGPLGLLVSYIATHWAQIKQDAVAAFNTVKTAIGNAWDTITSTVSNGIDKVANFMKSLPGRIVGAVGDLSHLLYNAGASIISGLIDGIKSKLGAAKDAIAGVAGSIAGHFPHSPAKEGPLKEPIDWGAYLMAGLPETISGVSGALTAITSGAGARAVAGGGGGGAAGTGASAIHVTVNGWVGSDQQIAQRLRNELVSLGRREPNIFAGYA